MRGRTARADSVSAAPSKVTEPLRPATKANPPGLEPGPARLELAVLPLHHRFAQSGRPESNGPPRSGAPVLYRLSYIREVSTPGWNRTSARCPRKAALCPLSYERKSPRQESNPHLGRTKGACLPLTLRRQSGDGGSRTHSSSVQTRRSTVRASSPSKSERCSSGGWPPLEPSRYPT